MKAATNPAIRVCLGLAFLGAAPRVFAQAAPPPPARPAPPEAATPQPVDPDSPRASIARYLELSREGQYGEAAAYLEVPESQRPRAAELARSLKAVLDRHLWLDLERLSPRSGGNEGDELPPGIDEIGRMPNQEPIRIVRIEDTTGPRWAFSVATVGRIDSWYAMLSDRWIRENAPEFLLLPGPKDVLWWQWVGLLIVGLLAMVGGRLLVLPTISILRRIISKTRTEWDDVLLERTTAPLTVLLGVGVAWLLVPALDLYAPGRLFIAAVLRAIALVAVFWALWRLVDVAESAFTRASWSQAASAKSLVSLTCGLAKVMVGALGLLAALAELGYPVSGVLAGLGIGGLALALAAQKTGENLFGSLSLALDRPFDVGEFVKVEDFVGHVENVGLRSTRFRTLDRTLITIPNGRVADMRIENYTSRDRMRLACTIGLVYSTTPAQARQVLGDIESRLRAHPKIWPDAVVVRFQELGASSLNIGVMAWFETPDWGEFQVIRQDILLQIMEVVENAGTSFAFPTQTVHLVEGPGPTGQAPAGPAE